MGAMRAHPSHAVVLVQGWVALPKLLQVEAVSPDVLVASGVQPLAAATLQKRTIWKPTAHLSWHAAP
jgi:hypothetical protein